MTMFVKTGGVWQTITDAYVKTGGVWEPLKQIWFQYDQFPPSPTPVIYHFPAQEQPVNLDGNINCAFYSGSNVPYPQGPGTGNPTAYWRVDGSFWSNDPLLYPSGYNHTVYVPYGCSQMRLTMWGQGGSGAASLSNTNAGSGGAPGVFSTFGFWTPVTEFEPITITVGPEADFTFSGDGADGADVTVSWTGNSITCNGGGGGKASGVQGTGSGVTGSGTAFSSGTKYTGNSGFINALGLTQGGGHAQNPPFGFEFFSYGGCVYKKEVYPQYNNIIEIPSGAAGGGGGYNCYGQRGGSWSVILQFIS